MISSTAGASGPYKVYKKDAEGNSTLLFTTISGFSGSPSVPDKMDVQFDYAVEGSLNIYINKVSVGSCTATDITTDGQTEVFGTYHASYENTPSNYSARFGTAFSECHVSDTDTRDVTCYTMTANNAGTLDQWTGSFTNVDEITVNDLNFDTTTTSGDTQRYLMTALPTGNFVIDSVFTNLRCTAGGGDLSQIAVAQLIGGVSYITSPQELPVALVAPGISFKQTVNPATGLSWQPSDFGITFESGYQALT
jgi:hypothetical protein